MARRVSRGRPGGGFQRGLRAPTQWSGFVAADATVAAGTAQTIGSFIAAANHPHETIVRVVGSWQVDGVGINGNVALGGVVVNEPAFAAGSASMPDPITEIQDDVWAFISTVSVGTLPRGVGQDDIRFDSRAMRKVEEGQRLVIIMSNGTDGNMGFSLYIRVLSKRAIRS